MHSTWLKREGFDRHFLPFSFGHSNKAEDHALGLCVSIWAHEIARGSSSIGAISYINCLARVHVHLDE
ncbi:hypothetical protein KFK09_008909 [Dendrobium nobile]|uniref:Uncharacterized protein n=1 Tax=Dendrobium nobile TaxID=94219 RepID=A0A8T3BMH6_DENNO|nr:hypothetical protein KFK09_008909 [Dendrobium nobile]